MSALVVRQYANVGLLMNSLSITAHDPEVNARLGDWLILYNFCIVTWIIFGLGYIFMIITVIADNLRRPASKAVRKLKEEVMATKIIEEVLAIRERAR